MTVNDMLFHVISFATLTIKLTVKSNPDLNTKTLHKSQSLSKIEDLAVPAAAQPTQSKVQLNPQQSFLQNYLMSLQSKQSKSIFFVNIFYLNRNFNLLNEIKRPRKF